MQKKSYNIVKQGNNSGVLKGKFKISKYEADEIIEKSQ